MRHLVAGKKLSRDSEHRRALKRNLAAALFISGRIKTTTAKAKFVRPFVERIITIARRGDLNARRQVIAMLQDRFIVDTDETDVKRNKSFKVVKAPTLIHKIFSEIAPKYADRPGGYTRLIRLAKPRLGDNGEVVYLELIDPEEKKTTRRSRTGGSRRRKVQARHEFLNRLLKPAKKPQSASPKSKKESPEPEPKAEAKAEKPAEGKDEGTEA